MAIRHLWFVASLAFAATLAFLAAPYLPQAVTWLGDAPVPRGVGGVRLHGLLEAAGLVSIGALSFFILYFVGLSLVDAVIMAVAQHRLTQCIEEDDNVAPADVVALLENYPGYEDAAAAYHRNLAEHTAPGRGKADRTRVISQRSASAFFGPMRLVSQRLARWFFDPLPVLLAVIGTALLLLAALGAVLPTRTETFGALLEPGISAFLLLATTALAIYALKRIILSLRYHQAAELCQKLDALYPTLAPMDELILLEARLTETSRMISTAVSSLSKDLAKTFDGKLKDMEKVNAKGQESLENALISGVEASLKEPLKTLAESSDRNADKITEQSQKALEDILSKFLVNLDKHFGAQLKGLATSMDETEKASKDLRAAFKESLEKHDKAIADNLSAYAGSFGQTAASFEAMQASVDNLLTLTAPLLRQMISHQEALMNALEQESSSSKVIGRAAGELSMAAKTSRDTVEQFVALADKLRDVGRATGAPRNGTAERQLAQELRSLKDMPDDA